MRRPFIFTSLGVIRGESKRGNRKCGPENKCTVLRIGALTEGTMQEDSPSVQVKEPYSSIHDYL